MYLVPLLCSIIMVASAFLLLERRYGQLYGFLGALLFFTNTLIYTYSLYILRDLPSLSFILLSYLFYDKSRVSSSNIYMYFLGISMAFAFLIRYNSLLGLIPVFIHVLYKKESWFWKPLIVFFIFILPWVAWSYQNHNTLLVEHTTYYLSKLTLYTSEMMENFIVFLKWFSPLVLLLFIGGLGYIWKDKNRKSPDALYLLLIFFTLGAFMIWPIKDERYLMLAIFPIVYFALKPIENLQKNLGTTLLVLIILMQLFTAMSHVNYAKNKYYLLGDGGHWINENTPEESNIMTQSFRQIAFYSKRTTYEVPVNEDWTPEFIEKYHVTHILIDSYERSTPEYIYEFVEKQGYKKIAEFKDENGWVKIYEV